jgi:hypothetical protein
VENHTSSLFQTVRSPILVLRNPGCPNADTAPLRMSLRLIQKRFFHEDEAFVASSQDTHPSKPRVATVTVVERHRCAFYRFILFPFDIALTIGI